MTLRTVLLLAAVGSPAAAADPAALAAKVDSRLAAGWDRAKVRPAPPADDAAFLRRASLDLVGRVPTVAEVRDFLADRSPDKRDELIDRLVASGGHARHMGTVWRRAWVPQADTPEFARVADEFEAWVAVRAAANVPYDRVVRELLTAPDAGPGAGAGPGGFFAANEGKPENLAASAARAFLGVNLDCAQCHDHPSARWSREQFWQTAAFFAPGRMGAGGPPTLPIPNTARTVTAELLDGSPLAWPKDAAPGTAAGRRRLAEWATADANPYFARNAVNRLWAQLFGTGLVEPLDDLSGENPASHPELLDELTRAFVESGYDVNHLTRALTRTKAYQLAAVGGDGGSSDPRTFARMPVRGLAGEQLYDSLRTAAGLPPERDDTGRGLGLEARKRFAQRFLVDRPAAAERSIVQALAVMNGGLTADLTDPGRSPTLAAAAAPFLAPAERVEVLFLAALGRPPTAKERSLVGTDDAALADLFWALLNSSEFNTNH